MTAPPVVQSFFTAMQAGASAADALLDLFHEDAVYIEPFTGVPLTHEGRDAIRAAFEAGWKTPLPEVRITVDRVDVEGPSVTARWTCHSPALPGGSAPGTNVFTVADGRITRLETTLG